MMLRVPAQVKIVALHLVVQISTATVVLGYVAKQVEQGFTRDAVRENRVLIADAASMIRLVGSDRAREVVEGFNAGGMVSGHRLRLVGMSGTPTPAAASLFGPGEVRTVRMLSPGRGIEASNDMREARRLGWVVGSALIGAILLGLEAGVLLAYLLMRGMRRRIMDIADVADDIGRGNLSRRLELASDGGPFDRLSQVLNSMFARLDSLMEELRAITDAVAHDVRSPLMRMRMHAEEALASSRIGAARPLLAKVLTEAETALRITSVAMEISRAEAGVDRAEFGLVDLADLTRDLADAYEPTAASVDVALTLAIDRVVPMVSGHRQLLGQVLCNLLDNVLRHAADGAVCELNVDCVAGHVRLQVADRGPGVAAGDMKRALGRFVKLNSARSNAGAGLGLALADAVVRLHGGVLSLEDNRPGLRVVIVLPATTRS